MRTRKKFLLAIVVSIATLIVAAVAAEIYLRRNPGPDVEPYLAEFYTHDGRKISAPVGGIRLGLAPFTVYQTLPSQHTSKFMSTLAASVATTALSRIRVRELFFLAVPPPSVRELRLIAIPSRRFCSNQSTRIDL